MYNNMRLVVLTFDSQWAFQTQEEFKWKNKERFQQGALSVTHTREIKMVRDAIKICFYIADPLKSNRFTLTSMKKMDHFMQIWNFFPSAFYCTQTPKKIF